MADPKLVPEEARDHRCACEVSQLKGAELRTCQTNPGDGAGEQGDGFCYVDEDRYESIDATLVQHCRESSKRIIRFVGGAKAPANAVTFAL